MGKKRHKRQPDQPAETYLPDIVDCGGQLMWVAGYTSGGAPYGVTEHDGANDPETRQVFEEWRERTGAPVRTRDYDSNNDDQPF